MTSATLLPAGLSREQAAAYVGLSVRGLEAAVARGDFRPPARVGSRVIYLRERLAADLERLAQPAHLAHTTDSADPWARWDDAHQTTAR